MILIKKFLLGFRNLLVWSESKLVVFIATKHGRKKAWEIIFVISQAFLCLRRKIFMNRSWLSIIVAAIFEVMWVIGLKHASTTLEWLGTLVAIFISFYLMIKAGEKLPVGTVYAVFVGLGTTGTILVDALVFKQPINAMTIIFLMILLVGVIGLKLSSDGKKEEN